MFQVLAVTILALVGITVQFYDRLMVVFDRRNGINRGLQLPNQRQLIQQAPQQ